jgi:hypothetical protein
MKKVKLNPNDRLILGTAVYLFSHAERAKDAVLLDTKERPITYEFAVSEKADLAADEEQNTRKEELKELLQSFSSKSPRSDGIP